MPPMLHSTPMLEVWIITCPYIDENWHRRPSQAPCQQGHHGDFTPYFLLLCSGLLFNFSFDTSMDLICITRHEPQRRGLTRYGEEGQKQEKQSSNIQDLNGVWGRLRIASSNVT